MISPRVPVRTEFFAPHRACVRMTPLRPKPVLCILFCLFQHGLLACGGGAADRRIHFYNTLTGAQLADIDTGAQVSGTGVQVQDTGQLHDSWQHPLVYRLIGSSWAEGCKSRLSVCNNPTAFQGAKALREKSALRSNAWRENPSNLRVWEKTQACWCQHGRDAKGQKQHL